jgi:uncharacterized low-complexity protein
MKSDKKILKSAAIIAGALLTTSLIAAPSVSPDILAYNDLGSGSEVRSQLINQNQVNGAESFAYKLGELKCGEGKCGEGKCGGDEKKEEAKTADAKTTDTKTADAKTADTKTADAKTADTKEAAPAKETAKKK